MAADPLRPMSSMGSMASLSSSAKVGTSHGGQSEKIKDAAQQFESLMIGELLKTSREAGSGGWLGTGEEDQSGETAVDLAEQQFATTMAKQGGIGLTNFITQSLLRKS